MKSISFESIVSELVNIFSNEAKKATYNDRGGACYIGLCGWAGTMSPANRTSFVETFGADVTSRAETAARQIIEEKEAAFAASHFSAHAATATANLGVNFVPSVGAYYWMVSSNFKQEGRGLLGELNYLCNRLDEEEETGKKISSRRLVRIDKVINVTEEELLFPATPDSLTNAAAVAGDPFRGGATSEDLGDDFNQYAPTDDELKTFYTVGVAVYCKDSGRWFLIDSEGYDYARYLYLPLEWLDMYAAEVAVIDAEKAAATRAAEEEETRARAARHAAYLARCEKWAKLMVNVGPYVAAVDAARAKFGGYSAEVKKAERALHNVSRKNILTMCRAAFPGVKFSLTQSRGWGASWNLSYIDGPTSEEFEEKTDLDLFAEYHDTFDGMTDCAGISHPEFTSFAVDYCEALYLGGVDVERKESDETRAAILDGILSAFPEFAEVPGCGWPTISEDRAREIREKLSPIFGDAAASEIEKTLIYDRWGRTASELQRVIFNKTSYFTASAPAPTPDDDPTRGRASSQADESGTASAAGLLVLEDYSAKAVAVFGPTAIFKDDLKRLGGRFNGRLKRNGTTCAGWIFSKSKADEVAAFIAAATAPAADPADVLPSLPGVVTVSPSVPVPAVSGSQAEEVAHIAPVVPSLCVADDGTTSNQDVRPVDTDKTIIYNAYVMREKSPILSGDLAEGFNRILELYPRVAYQLWPAYQNVITACVLYLQYLESLSADVKNDRYAVKMLSYYSALRDIADQYLKKRDAARLDVSPASIEADERLQISALTSLQPVWAELHHFTDSVLSEVLEDHGFILPRVHYDVREKSLSAVPSEATNVFRVRCRYEADGMEPVFDEFLEMGPRSNLDKLIGLPHRKCEYWKKGYQCKDFIVCDSPSAALDTIYKIAVPDLYFIDADGEKIAPSRVWFGTDTRWARTEGGAPNGRAFTAYNGRLCPVYLGDGSRLVDASLCNVTANYVDGCLSDFRVG